MNTRSCIYLLIIMCGALVPTSALAVSDWAIKRAHQILTELRIEQETTLVIALAKKIEKEERSKTKWPIVKAIGKGTWLATKNTFKGAVFLAKFMHRNVGKRLNLDDILDEYKRLT